MHAHSMSYHSILPQNIEKWQLKVLVIGEDNNEMLYWYFTGTRIYCQDTSVSERRRTSESNHLLSF